VELRRKASIPEEGQGVGTFLTQGDEIGTFLTQGEEGEDDGDTTQAEAIELEGQGQGQGQRQGQGQGQGQGQKGQGQAQGQGQKGHGQAQGQGQGPDTGEPPADSTMVPPTFALVLASPTEVVVMRVESEKPANASDSNHSSPPSTGSPRFSTPFQHHSNTIPK
jgi:hypothetical protein